MQQKERSVGIDGLSLAYLFLIPFVRLFYLPVVYAKVQLTEVVFLALAGWFVYGCVQKNIRVNWKEWLSIRWLIVALVIYVLTNLCSAYLSADFDAILEGFGRVYLVVLCLMVAWWIKSRGPQGINKALQAWLRGGVVMATISLLGYGLALWGYPNSTVAVIKNYPYWGTVYRAAGLAGGSGHVGPGVNCPDLIQLATVAVKKRPMVAMGFVFDNAFFDAI